MTDTNDLMFLDIIKKQKEISELLSHKAPSLLLTPIILPSRVIIGGGDAARMYFQSGGARVIADRVIITWSMSTSVLVAINEDPNLFDTVNNYGTGFTIFGTPFNTGYAAPAYLEIAAPIEFLSFKVANTTAGNHVGINAQGPNPAFDSGYITVWAWATSDAGLLLQGNR